MLAVRVPEGPMLSAIPKSDENINNIFLQEGKRTGHSGLKYTRDWVPDFESRAERRFLWVHAAF